MSEPSRTQRFLAEMKRRRVFRVMAVYGATAFVVVQVADLLQEALRLPEAFLTIAAVLALLGLPIALVLAWVYERTADGVQKTSPAQPGELTEIVAAPAASRWPIGVAAAAGTALFLVGTWLALGRPGASLPPALDSDAPVESIAVLPFVDLSPDGDQQYFGDGLAEELLDALAKVDGLVVMARTSSFRFKGADVDIVEVADQLKVQTVLEGSVRRGGDRVRITAQLVNADGVHLWSESYDRSADQMADLIGVQEEIAQSIVTALSLEPGEGEPTETLVALGTDNLEAYNTVLRGRYLMAQRTPRALVGAAEEFEEAIALDPDYARAWADLALAHNLALAWGYTADSLVERRAAEAMARALELDPMMPQAYAAQGLFYAWIQGDSAAANTNYQRAIELDPRYAAAYQWQGEILGFLGHPENGIPYLQTARELDPLSPIIFTDFATILDLAGRWEEAERLLVEVMELEPDFAPAFLARSFHAEFDNDPHAALAYQNRFQERTAQSDPVYRAERLSLLHYFVHDHTAVVETFRTVVPTDTSRYPFDSPGIERAFLVSLRETAGPAAVEVYADGQRSRIPAIDSVRALWLEGYAAAVMGNEADARVAVERLTADETVPGWRPLSISLALGDTAAVLDGLEDISSVSPTSWIEPLDDPTASSARPTNPSRWVVRNRFQLEHDPSLDVLRDDPRFQAFMAKLPPYPGPNARGTE